jgi:hypothetical protein
LLEPTGPNVGEAAETDLAADLIRYVANIEHEAVETAVFLFVGWCLVAAEKAHWFSPFDWF